MAGSTHHLAATPTLNFAGFEVQTGQHLEAPFSANNLMSSIIKGIGGVLAALLIFAGEQYIQHRFWPDKPTPQPVITDGSDHEATPAAKAIPIDGQVTDTGGSKVIENALVELAIGDIHENQNTDSLGRYAFSLKGFDPETVASMTIQAPGYKRFTANLLLSKLEEDKDQKLEAVLQPNPPKGLGAIVGAVYVGPKPGAVAGGQAAVPLKYVRRFDSKVIVARN